jgi:hypothetical protein
MDPAGPNTGRGTWYLGIQSPESAVCGTRELAQATVMHMHNTKVTVPQRITTVDNCLKIFIGHPSFI